MFKSTLVLMISLMTSLSVFGLRNFDSIAIPGAKCGDGSPYKVFLETRSNSRLAFKIQGGGACWSHFTCFTLGTTRGSIPDMTSDDEGFAAENSRYTPVADYSFVLFPYCTGDVHLGTHTARYKDKTYHHEGKNNIQMALEYLVAENLIAFEYLDDFVMYGESAGAIGALYHINTVAPYTEHISKKSLILDAPGLHFGDSFWYSFTDELFADYGRALSEVGLNIQRDQGLIAQAVPNVCAMHRDWQVAVVQGTRDSIMSLIFGSISPADHEALVLGPGGIQQLTADPTDNCSAFVARTRVHVLLTKNRDLDIEAGGTSAIEFAYKFVSDGSGANYIDDEFSEEFTEQAAALNQ